MRGWADAHPHVPLQRLRKVSALDCLTQALDQLGLEEGGGAVQPIPQDVVARASEEMLSKQQEGVFHNGEAMPTNGAVSDEGAMNDGVVMDATPTSPAPSLTDEEVGQLWSDHYNTYYWYCYQQFCYQSQGSVAEVEGNGGVAEEREVFGNGGVAVEEGEEFGNGGVAEEGEGEEFGNGVEGEEEMQNGGEEIEMEDSGKTGNGAEELGDEELEGEGVWPGGKEGVGVEGEEEVVKELVEEAIGGVVSELVSEMLCGGDATPSSLGGAEVGGEEAGEMEDSRKRWAQSDMDEAELRSKR